MLFLYSADFFQNQLFRKTLSGIPNRSGSKLLVNTFTINGYAPVICNHVPMRAGDSGAKVP